MDSHARVVQLFQQAQEAAQNNDQSRATELYRDIVAIDPNIAEVWSNLGMALYRQDRYEESITAFDRAATLKPSLLAPHLFAGLAYQSMGEAAKAVGPLKAALALEPNQPEATVALCDAYAQTRQFDASVLLLKVALKRDPDSESLSSNLAATYQDWARDVGTSLRRSPSLYGRLISDVVHEARDAEAAEAALRATVAYAPDSLEARLELARFLIETGPTAEKLQAGEEQIEAARKIAPGDPDVDAEELRLALARNDFPRALALLQVLMREDRAFTLANLDVLAEGLPAEDVLRIKEEGETDSAMPGFAPGSFSSQFATLARVKSKRPLTVAEAAEYVSAAWHLHRYDEALAEMVSRHRTEDEDLFWMFCVLEALGGDVLRQTVKAHPDSLRSHLLLADLAIQREDYREAKSEYQTALSLSPHNPEIMLLNVRLLETANDTQQALAEAVRGAAEFPSNADLNFEAGELTLRRANDAGTAAKYLEQALKVNAGLVRARVDLADAYADLNRLDDAIGEIKQIASTDEDGALHYRLARWYRQNGNPEEAAKALEISKRMKEQKFEKDTTIPAGQSATPTHDPT